MTSFLSFLVFIAVAVVFSTSDEDWLKYNNNPMTSSLSGARLRSDLPPFAWLRYIINRSLQPAVAAGDEFDSLELASLANSETGSFPPQKRNNGAWVWMPAQGYVSLPKNQQTADANANGKHGKIMRYGK